MAVKVLFEIGHTAKLKSKKTPDGFTHDWELFVRGVDKADISHFVDKVVFNLHDSFPKPKRTCKEAPYVLKESGYAGFVLPIDIFVKNRDEPKKITFTYDLDLQQSGPPVYRSEIKKYVFNNPSEEFRQKLMKGGGILVSNVDEKSRESTDDRSQLLSKPKLNSDISKKYKFRPDDSFATLFGPPITKTSAKVSPDPKAKASPSVLQSNKHSSKTSEKISSSSSALQSKDKIDKSERKDKHKRSPHKDRTDSSKDTKKSSSEDKHDRGDSKKKAKSHSKERERSRDKNSKRPSSPKRISSPKRLSPPRSSSANRPEENASKTSKVPPDPESKKSSSSSGKKSKKDKKSQDKDKDRDRREKDRVRKEKEDRSHASNTSQSVPSGISHSGSTHSKPTTETKVDNIKKERDAAASIQSKDSKDVKKPDAKLPDSSTSPAKKTHEKYDKDTERRHKHKKKDKNKDKDKERDKDHSSREKKKEKSSKHRDESKKIPQHTTQHAEAAMPAPQKPSTNSLNNLKSKNSEHESSDSGNASPSQLIPENRPNFNHSDNTNYPFFDVPKTIIIMQYDDSKVVDKKEKKSRDKNKEKDEKKRKRKNKDESDLSSRKSTSPAVSSHTEPPNKQVRKEESNKKDSPTVSSSSQNISQAVPHRISSPLPSTSTAHPSTSSEPQPSTSSAPQPSTSSAPQPSTSSAPQPSTSSAPQPSTSSAPYPSTSSSYENMIKEQTVAPLTTDYMSELRELQQKIMTLQDNNELQTVVEMIAATGQFQMTSKTFDFDLCALDRTTVQRLQDFLSTTVS